MEIISKFLRLLKKQFENVMFVWRVIKLRALYPGILIDFKTKIEKDCSIICVKGGTLKLLNSTIGFGTHIKVDSGATIRIYNSFIGRNCVITSKSEITIKKKCFSRRNDCDSGSGPYY